MSEQTAWERAFVRARHADDTLAAALSRAIDALTSTDIALDPASRYVAAFSGLHAEVRYILKEIGALRAESGEMVVKAIAARTPRTLEAVLADIEAEGHGDWDLGRFGSLDVAWYCRSSLPGHDPGLNASKEDWAAWRVRAECGEAGGTSAIEAAEARLAQIRELHAEKTALAIETTAHLQAVGETDIGDPRPLLVDPLDTFADAFAARRMDDDRVGSDAERGEA